MTDTNEEKSLNLEEIVTERRHGRRSALAVLGGVAAGGAMVVAGLTASPAEAQVTDSDSGRNADPAGGGGGHGGRSPGSDSDTGRGSDPAGRGRRSRSRGSCSDSDSGRWADAAGRGTRC
ncbi:MAG: hypothetical protein AB8I08_15775 [Sandaracinaceae bacterium]